MVLPFPSSIFTTKPDFSDWPSYLKTAENAEIAENYVKYCCTGVQLNAPTPAPSAPLRPCGEFRASDLLIFAHRQTKMVETAAQPFAEADLRMPSDCALQTPAR